MSKPKILFLCTGNSCRSQMAEGWGNSLQKQDYEFFSAGIEKHGLNPNAVKVMHEVGVDISKHQSKILSDLGSTQFELVFTVCGHADETCPLLPAATRVIHVGFDDPPKLAKTARNEQEALAHYRRVRDEIKVLVESLDKYFDAVTESQVR